MILCIQIDHLQGYKWKKKSLNFSLSIDGDLEVGWLQAKMHYG